ncbi:MAG: sigma 54-interacting transcriptional regulator [Vicinamibacteria bacterium]
MTERFRLRGDVGGVPKTYILEPGETGLGSISENGIVLPVRGVSRRHALLRLTESGAVIEDLESRNGVFVNGVRAMSARLKPGDEIRIGPVTFRLEPVASDDAQLGIDLGPRPRPDGLPPETTSVLAQLESGHAETWLRVFDGILEKLTIRPEADVRGALALVLTELGARGGCIFEWRRGEGVVLMAAGQVGDLGSLRSLSSTRLFGSEGQGDTAMTWTLLQPGSGTHGLALWGDFPGRQASEKPLRTLLRLWQRLQPEPVRKLQEPSPVRPRELTFPEGCIPGESSAMRSLYGQMKLLVQGDLPVLILGETGVGKELIARTLHASSRRPKGPFVAVNCAAIPTDQLEAEMFGVARGAATGVVERPGKFRLAQGGTLLLDEIGDMPLDLQAKLLRALQEKEIQPLGGGPVPVDLRVVTATNTDLDQRIEQGRFRRDLYFRIAGYALHVPALRERRDDVAALVESFLREFARECRKSIRGITLKALRILTDYDWPGNVRELEHEVRRLAYICPDGEAVDSSMLSPHVLVPSGAAAQAPENDDSDIDLDASVRRVEERVIRRALAKAGGNRTQAAKLLGISRNGLSDKMERLGIAE